MSLQQPKAVYAVCEQHYTAAGGEVQLPCVMSDGRWNKEMATQIGKRNAVLYYLHRYVVTKWELSNTAKLSAHKNVFVSIVPMFMNLR